MRRHIMLVQLIGPVALAFAVAACSDTTSSVEEFVSMATDGVFTTFEPLASPKDAVDKGDLIVEGTLTEVADGIRFQSADPAYADQSAADSYMTLVVSVTTVIDGDPTRLSDGRAYVAVHKSPLATTGQLSKVNSRPRIVAVLADITSWAPARGVTVVRPAAVPHGATLYAPYTDGMWLQASGDTEMHSLGARRDQLAPAWGEPQRVDDFSAALRRV